MFRGSQVGFGARNFQSCYGLLRKCWEKLVDACDNGPTDGCCGVVQCEWCLSLEFYDGSPTEYGVALWDGSQWIGTVGGHVFVAYWRRDYGDQCQLYVEFDDEVVEELMKCYIVDCRDPGGSTEVTVDGYPAILRWYIRKPLSLKHITVDGCVDNFCGNCECTCQALCVTVTTPIPDCQTCIGTLPGDKDSYGTPFWRAIIECTDGERDIGVRMTRSEYDGSCEITLNVDGEETEPVGIAGCNDISGQWVLYDGTIITIRCRGCSCEEIPGCDVGCCWPVIYNDLYPCGYHVPLVGEISAPGCISLDGQTVTFNATGAVSDKGSCGACFAVGAERIQTGGSVPSPGMPSCGPTPCAVFMCLYLECTDDSVSPEGLESCCGGFRLWVGTSEKMTGDVGDRPSDSNIAAGCLYWRKISPSNCECIGNSEAVMLQFEVSLESDCDTVHTTPEACVGLPNCCDPFCSGFTLTI